MSAPALPGARAGFTSPGDQERWLARRRWARAGWLYAFMIAMSFVFLGPFLMGVVSSVKDNPNEYPPKLIIPQFTPAYIGRAWTQGVQGAADGWNGGLTPGRSVTFDTTVDSPARATPSMRIATVPW